MRRLLYFMQRFIYQFMCTILFYQTVLLICFYVLQLKCRMLTSTTFTESTGINQHCIVAFCNTCFCLSVKSKQQVQQNISQRICIFFFTLILNIFDMEYFKWFKQLSSCILLKHSSFDRKMFKCSFIFPIILVVKNRHFVLGSKLNFHFSYFRVSTPFNALHINSIMAQHHLLDPTSFDVEFCWFNGLTQAMIHIYVAFHMKIIRKTYVYHMQI